VTDEAIGAGADQVEIAACDIAVVGAGAAGLAAGIFAGEESGRIAPADGPRPSIVILDGAKKIGAKILVSGGGRCNVTNEEVLPQDFNGNQPFIRNVLAAFTARAGADWFESLGVRLVREDLGKLFPERGGAKAVLGALIERCGALGIPILTERRVNEISSTLLEGDAGLGGIHAGDGSAAAPSPVVESVPIREFSIRHDRGVLRARRVILATGGQSLPLTGSDGKGWQIARDLGHSVTPVHPALVPLLLDRGMFHAALSGLSHPAELSTYADGKRIDRRSGSLLWTHFGISGPVVLDASRHWISARAKGSHVELRCNFLPGWNAERLDGWLIRRVGSTPRRSVARVLCDLLPERIGRAHLTPHGIDPAMPIGELKRGTRRRLAASLLDTPLPVTGDRGWNYAEVTAGGVPLREIDYRTMASRTTPGLYLIGEMLDCDGRIGGFNFQWAWATGRLAGVAAARDLLASASSPPVGSRRTTRQTAG
jgi:predicted flavoprotein YhiN